jgi:hypothetical protein
VFLCALLGNCHYSDSVEKVDNDYWPRDIAGCNGQERFPPPFSLLKDTYATNVFPFVKRGSMDAPIPPAVLTRAATVFAIPQIEIVAPRFAICLGKAAFDAAATAAGHSASTSMNEAISSPFVLGTTKVWCQAHTGQMGVNNRGGLEKRFQRLGNSGEGVF